MYFFAHDCKAVEGLKSVSFNSTLAVRSGFDLHRFLQVDSLNNERFADISSRSHGVIVSHDQVLLNFRDLTGIAFLA